jgi:hypothetical protein
VPKEWLSISLPGDHRFCGIRSFGNRLHVPKKQAIPREHRDYLRANRMRGKSGLAATSDKKGWSVGEKLKGDYERKTL